MNEIRCATRSTYHRPDSSHWGWVHIDDDEDFAEAPQTPDASLDTDTPEISLLCAVLERAILDLGGRGNENGTARASTVTNALEAFEWVATNDEDVWSFVWVCDHLLLSVSATRQQMFVLATRLRQGTRTKTHGGWYAGKHRSAL